MLPLLVTALATAYFVVPELLSRFILSTFLTRRVMNSPKSEELMRAVLWAVIPLGIAWITRDWWYLGICKFPPAAQASAKNVFAGLYSEKLFEANPQALYSALPVFIRANISLLCREYAIVAIWATLIGLATRYFAQLRSLFREHKFFWKILHRIVIPRISEWHILLSPMMLKHKGDRRIEVDVLTKSGILYRGTVYERNIGPDGTLQTLILEHAQRFLHADFVRVRTIWESGSKTEEQKPNSSDYWRPIPGKLFLIIGADISSVNVRHELVSAAEKSENDEFNKVLDDLRRFVAERSKPVEENN